MRQFDHLMTARVLALKSEAEQLRPDRPIDFEVMHDAVLLQRSAGAAIQSDADREIILLDPPRANEFAVAHELSHAILRRSNWPQMMYLLPRTTEENIESRIADDLNNTIHHCHFYPRLEQLGFDVSVYKEWLVTRLEQWSADPIDGPRVLVEAIKLLDALIVIGTDRRRAIDIVKCKQPGILSLAEKLERRVCKADHQSALAQRAVMIRCLSFLNRWIAQQSHRQQNLREVIGISPVFTQEELDAAASQQLSFVSHALTIGGEGCWFFAYEMKADNTRIWAQTMVHEQQESPLVVAKRKQVETSTLAVLLKTEQIPFGHAERSP